MLPIGHSLAGFTIYGFFNLKKVWRQDFWCILLYIFLANLPDIDFIPAIFGFIFGFDAFSGFHRGLTHTLLFAILAAALFSVGVKFITETPFWASFPIFFLLIYSHVLIDIFCTDTSPPKGVMALYPLTDHYFTIPLLPQVSHGNLQELFSTDNLKTAIFELCLFSPFLFALLYLKRRKGSDLKS